MGYVLSDGEIDILNNANPANQVVQLGTRIDNALGGQLSAGSVAVDELQSGVSVGIAVEDAKTTSREENVTGLATAIALANSLKTITDAHGADAVEHATAADTVNYPIVADDATDLTTLIALVTELLTAYEAHDADAELGSGWAFHGAQEAGDHSLASAVAPITLQESITKLNDLKAKYNAHDADSTAHVTGSTHQESTADGSYGAAIFVVSSNVLAGDTVQWGVIDGGTGTVTGVTAVAGAGGVTFTFSADPQNDAIISYSVFRASA